jgi:hypothetical protein
MLSNLPSTQPWINQFLPIHKKTAKALLDEILVIDTKQVIGDLKTKIESIVPIGVKAAILPVRELIEGEESIYSLEDLSAHPTLQTSEEPLGSEAFISNLYTQLNRAHPRKFPLENQKPPSLNMIMNQKFDKIILVDDLVGSGERTLDFLSTLYKHPKLRSWISSKHIEIDVVAFMASQAGQRLIRKWSRNESRAKLHFLNLAPSFHDLKDSAPLIQICLDYADKKERLPLGFEDTAIRVVFSHSAPNNLPAILYRSIFRKYKPTNANLHLELANWVPLFPRRAVPREFMSQYQRTVKTISKRVAILEVMKQLQVMRKTREELAKGLNWSLEQVEDVVQLCIRLEFLVEENEVITLSGSGLLEISELTRTNYSIEFNHEFYYPQCLSRT